MEFVDLIFRFSCQDSIRAYIYIFAILVGFIDKRTIKQDIYNIICPYRLERQIMEIIQAYSLNKEHVVYLFDKMFAHKLFLSILKRISDSALILGPVHN